MGLIYLFCLYTINKYKDSYIAQVINSVLNK
jgi:hypothetical protein